MYPFRTRGLIFRKGAVTSTRTVQYMSAGMVHIGTSECGFAVITTKGFISMYKMFEILEILNIPNFKYQILNIPNFKYTKF